METRVLVPLLPLLLPLTIAAQGQRADAEFVLPDTGPAAFAPGEGPLVGIDEAHHNYHTATGRYRAFASLLHRDGYRVTAFSEEFSESTLQAVDVLVISNALSAENVEDWSLPAHPAFTGQEVRDVADWVFGGGRLLLIADHMPMPGAAADLAMAFGVLFHNGYAFGPDGSGRVVFRRANGSLVDHEVIRDEGGGHVPHVVTFGGQAFRLAPGVRAEPLLRLPEDSFMLLPSRAGEFDQKTPRIPAVGLLQGALLRFGAGRVAVFGEAAQFSAQLSSRGSDAMGMNAPGAEHNARFLLNVMRWLLE